MSDDRIEVTEIIVIDRENDVARRTWVSLEGTVIKDEVASPSPWRMLKFSGVNEDALNGRDASAIKQDMLNQLSRKPSP